MARRRAALPTRELQLLFDMARKDLGQIKERKKAEQELEKTKQENETLKALATTDPLTGLPNRRRFENDFKDEVAKAYRANQQGDNVVLAVIMLDIDHFKTINDTYGHDGGDKALQHLADHFSVTLRAGDKIYRLGGEEFVILAPIKKSEDCFPFVDRLREGFKNGCCVYDNQEIAMTASFGAALCSPSEEPTAETLKEILKRADNALYAAKHDGRDRTVVAEEGRIFPVRHDPPKASEARRAPAQGS